MPASLGLKGLPIGTVHEIEQCPKPGRLREMDFRMLSAIHSDSYLKVEVRWRTNGVRDQVVRSSRTRPASQVETFPGANRPTGSAEEPEVGSHS